MNTTNVILGLAQSIAILVTLAFIYSLLRPLLLPIPTRLRSLIQGLIFGLFGLLAILTGLPLSPGFSLDGRTVILSIAGFIGGPITGLIAALIAAAYRGLVVGGAGAPTGVVVCFTSAAVGVGAYWYSQRKSVQPTARWFLLLGLLTVFVR
ncbi:MAG: LytS/YhcK type 5TM receptor domain-containing protein, partial [Chloroflexota bacterium]